MQHLTFMADTTISLQAVKDNNGLIAIIAGVCLLIGFRDRIRR